MFTLIFFILLIIVFGKLVKLSVKAAWGITHVVLTLVIFPIILVMMVIGGLIYIALPILGIMGVIVLVKGICD